MTVLNTVPDTLKKLTELVVASGGRALLVGGAVRDFFLFGVEPKDWDVELHGLSVAVVKKLLSQFGEVNAVGAAFGVLKVTDANGVEFDFTLPRRENKVGKGHKGFMVELDTAMTPKDAAARRDFTVNSMAVDLATGELLDPFNGMADLKAGVLRHTSDAFAEDALRVLRGMQFAARFDFTMAPETVALSKSLVDKVKFVEKVNPDSDDEELAVDRVLGEFVKLATKGKKPSAGLKVLKDTGWLKLFPELAAMDGLAQEPEWHPEGDVWAHTLHTVDAAARLADKDNLNSKDRTALFFGALLHDVGKPLVTVTTKEGRVVSPGHANAGVKLAESFMEGLRAPKALTKAVAVLVKEHMVHVGADMTERAVRRLSDRVDGKTTVEMVDRVIQADAAGRPPLSDAHPCPELMKLARELAVERNKPSPLLTGKHLVALGLKPGPVFGKILRAAFELQLNGELKTETEALTFANSQL
jgi:tRNA nucleotidyltransferase (CCA-adding enzyme)